jgi:hypothetical protein
VENRQDTAILLNLRFATDPSRRDDCRIYKELDIAIPDESFPKQHIMGFNKALSKVNLKFDVQFPSESKKINKQLVWRCVGLDGPVDGKWESERCLFRLYRRYDKASMSTTHSVVNVCRDATEL